MVLKLFLFKGLKLPLRSNMENSKFYAVWDPVSYTHLDVYKRQRLLFL